MVAGADAGAQAQRCKGGRGHDNIRAAVWKPIALLMIPAALAACSTGPSLSDAMLSQPPAGYHGSSVTGSLDAGSAAEATPANASDVTKYFNHHPLADGYSVVWQAGSDFITVIGLRFNDSDSAAGLIKLEVKQLSASTTNVVPDARIANATTFVLFGKTRLQGHEVFCSGEVWPEQHIAFLVTTCSEFPNSAVQARQLAVDQYLKAERSLSLDVPAPQPS